MTMRRLVTFVAFMLVLSGCGSSAHFSVSTKRAPTKVASLVGAPCASQPCGPYAATFKWAGISIDNQTGFYVYKDGSQIDEVSIATYVLHGIRCDSVVEFGVRAHDGSGNTSPLRVTDYKSPPCNTPAAGGFFGLQTVGGTANGGMTADVKRASKAVATVSGQLTKLTMYLSHPDAGPSPGTQNLRNVIYADSGGSPGALLGVTDELTFTQSSAAGWYSLDLPNSIHVDTGTTYWLGMITGPTTDVIQFYYDSAPTNNWAYSPNTYTSGASDPFGTVNTWNPWVMSEYATVQPGGAPANTVAPALSGTASVGNSLTTTNGTWAPTASSYTYSWQSCDSNGINCQQINGATASAYTVTSGDIGRRIRSIVTAINNAGQSSHASDVTTAVPGTAPGNTGLPIITGTPIQGQSLSTSNGTWTGSPTTYGYQWRKCDAAGANCANATGSGNSCSNSGSGCAYTLVADDVGHTMRVVVTATNGNGSTPATSVQTSVVTGSSTPVNTVLPVISGNATVGSTLTTTDGTWTSGGSAATCGGGVITCTYQWQHCAGSTCTNAFGTGATTASYVVAAGSPPTGDVGDSLQVIVTATNANGSTAATSTQTTTVPGQGAQTCYTAPGTCGYPDPVGANDPGGVPNVGVPSGTSLANASGPITVSSSGCSICTGSGTYIDPYVIDARNITGTDSGNGSGIIMVNTDNVVIQNTRITDTSSPGNCSTYPPACSNADIYVSGAYHVWVSHVEMTAGPNAYLLTAIRNNFGGTVYVDHSYQHGNTDTICLCLSSQSTFNDNYSNVHAAITGDHMENTYNNDTRGYIPSAQLGGEALPTRSMTFNHNTFFNTENQTANIFMDAGGGAGNAQCINRAAIANNLFAGGGFTFYLCGNSSSTSSSGSGNPGAGAVVANNRMARCGTSEVAGGGGTWLCSGGADTNGLFPRGGSFGTLAGPTNQALTLCGVNGSVWYGNTWANGGSVAGNYGACAATSQTDCFISPGACGYPDPNYNNVGPTPGTTFTQRGSMTINSPGTYSDLAVNGSITVNSSNVTITNSRVWSTSGGCNPSGNPCGNYQIAVTCNCSNVVLSHLELGSASDVAYENAVRTQGNPNAVTISYVYAHGDVDALCECDNGNVDNDYSLTNLDTSGDHLENLQTQNPPYTLHVNHDTLFNPYNETTEVFGQTGFNPTASACAQHISVTNSILGGGNAVLETCANSSTAGSAVVNIENNRFVRCNHGAEVSGAGGTWVCANGFDQWGWYPRGGDFNTASYQLTCGGQNGSTWTGNVWDDNLATIPC